MEPTVENCFWDFNRTNAYESWIKENVKDKVVMITGAGGSIGSELCRQILVLKPKIIVMYEMSEFALYEIDRELSGQSSQSDVKLIPILGTVTDCKRLLSVFKK